MKEVSRHECYGRRYVLFSDEGLYYQFWSGDLTRFHYNVITGPRNPVTCAVCGEMYDNIHTGWYGAFVDITNWEAFLSNPLPIIMRAML